MFFLIFLHFENLIGLEALLFLILLVPVRLVVKDVIIVISPDMILNSVHLYSILIHELLLSFLLPLYSCLKHCALHGTIFFQFAKHTIHSLLVVLLVFLFIGCLPNFAVGLLPETLFKSIPVEACHLMLIAFAGVDLGFYFLNDAPAEEAALGRMERFQEVINLNGFCVVFFNVGLKLFSLHH